MINCYIIEDEEPAVELLKLFIAEHGQLHLTGYAHYIKDKLPSDVNENTLLFLDINLPFQSGLDFLRQSSVKLPVIFTTSNSEYALEAYNLHVIDYLLKPFSKARFNEAVAKAFRYMHMEKYISFKYNYQTIRLNQDQILYIEGQKQYLKLVTASKNYMILSTFKDMELQLDNFHFLRIHKSYMVNLTHIESYTQSYIKIKNDELPIGKVYLEEVKKRCGS